MFTMIKHVNDISIYDIYDRHMLAIPTCYQNKSYSNALWQYSVRRTK